MTKGAELAPFVVMGVLAYAAYKLVVAIQATIRAPRN